MAQPQDAVRRRLAVVGAGYVGLVSAVALAAKGHGVELVETNAERVAALREGRVPFSEPGLQEALSAALGSGQLTILDRCVQTTADIAIVCVGTPIDEAGRADVSAIEAVLAELGEREAVPVIVIRSTLPIGTSRRLLAEGRVADPARFFAVPEFLSQGSALDDFERPRRVVIGGSRTADPDARRAVTEIFGEFGGPVRQVSLEEAELVKNGANAFLALKLSFTNEVAVLAERSGADVGPVLEAIGLDPRIGSGYMRPSFGFGGSCLPKELLTVAASGRELALEMHVASAATEANLAHQRLFAERVDGLLDGVDGKRVAVLGLAFKADTDDIRYSPAVALAGWLIARGAHVVAFDPVAGHAALRELPDLEVRGSALAALDGADAGIIATEWPEFVGLDWAEVRASMRTPTIIDGRRLLDPGAMRELGFRYERVGSPLSEAATATPPGVPATIP